MHSKMHERELEFAAQLREANEHAGRVELLESENADLKRESKEDAEKYNRLMQGIVQVGSFQFCGCFLCSI